jgi:hypothetical protein
MQPGGALVQDNWAPTMRGVKLRGGYVRWCDLHALDVPGAVAWANNTLYNTLGAVKFDADLGTFWNVAVSHTSAASGTFAADRTAHPTFWTANPTVITRLPVISSFEYVSGNTQRMYAAQATNCSITTSSTPIVIASGQSSSNWAAAQFFKCCRERSANWMIAVNERPDYPLRFNGTSWAARRQELRPRQRMARLRCSPAGSVEFGEGLSYVWKYREGCISSGAADGRWYLRSIASAAC